MEPVTSIVADCQGIRLDKYLCQQLPELSRAQVQRLIADGRVKVNHRTHKSSYKLNAGELLTVMLPHTTNQLSPEDIPVTIIYEDDDLLVVDKPAGLTVHPAPGHPSHTLVNAILPHLATFPGNMLRPGIVHRLDKDTSGLMVVAKNHVTYTHLINQFKTRAVTKFYQVLVTGRLTPETGAIDAPIGRDPRHRQRMAIVADGRPARSDYSVVKYIDDFSLLEVRPHTGRTHQIRVHLAAIGHPVVGDKIYGVKSPGFPRQFLHASRLGFTLPSTGQYTEFTSPLPADLAEALTAVG